MGIIIIILHMNRNLTKLTKYFMHLIKQNKKYTNVQYFLNSLFISAVTDAKVIKNYNLI